jgi:hypothetical protein
MIISGHYALAANNVAANDQISCSVTLLIWQGDPPLYFIFKTKKVVGDHLAT